MLPPIDESKYIDLARWFRYVRDPYLQGASSRTTLFTRLSPAIGTWRMDNFKGLYGREVSIIVELDPHGLIDSELDTQGRLLPDRREDAQRYAQWICEGHLPPPIEVLETDKGNLKVTDGHRRLVAAEAPAYLFVVGSVPRSTCRAARWIATAGQ